MGRYIVSAGHMYSRGGMNDFVDTFDNLKDAVKCAELEFLKNVATGNGDAWSHIADMHLQDLEMIVWTSDYNFDYDKYEKEYCDATGGICGSCSDCLEIINSLPCY